MKGIAQISFHGGGLVLTAKTPYDRELLFEHIKQYVNRYGLVRLQLNRREWTVSPDDGQHLRCATCQQPDRLMYERDGRSICSQCARREVR
jgi:hypothetical protein